MWEKAVMAYFKILFRQISGESKKNHGNVSQNTVFARV
jgi:hypothetical protein